MSDFSYPIAVSIQQNFPDARRGKCYFHMVQNIIKRYNKKRYEDLRLYVEFLGCCLSVNELKTAWDLIKKD